MKHKKTKNIVHILLGNIHLHKTSIYTKKSFRELNNSAWTKKNKKNLLRKRSIKVINTKEMTCNLNTEYNITLHTQSVFSMKPSNHNMATDVERILICFFYNLHFILFFNYRDFFSLT